jgi:toxin ParE1/3/4
VRLSDSALADFREILTWTRERFGMRQARSYQRTLQDALHSLTAGPDVPGARTRDVLGPGLRSLHVARRGRPGRHFVIFRLARENGTDVIRVLRLLHDSMDLPQHTEPPREDP